MKLEEGMPPPSFGPPGMMPPPGMGPPSMFPPNMPPPMGPPSMMGPPGMMPPGMPPPGMMPPGMPPPGMMPPGMSESGEMLALPMQGGEERPTKKRRLRGLDVVSLMQLLTGLHQCLERLMEFSAGVKTDKEDSQPADVPVQHLEEEFERHWRLRFDACAVGEPNTSAFLRRFPGVFKVRSNGFQTVVAPVEDPNFEDAAQVGIEKPGTAQESEAQPDFSVGYADQVASLLCNLVADERKSSGAPLNFQFANYEVIQDLLSRLRDGSRGDEDTLLNALLDPKPPDRKEEQRRQHQERQLADDMERDRPLPIMNHDRDQDFGPRGDRGPPRHDNFDGPRRYGGGKGGGGGGGGGNFNPDRRGGDGRSVCRQFQAGRCTYGDTCKFAHEKDPDRR